MNDTTVMNKIRENQIKWDRLRLTILGESRSRAAARASKLSGLNNTWFAPCLIKWSTSCWYTLPSKWNGWKIIEKIVKKRIEKMRMYFSKRKYKIKIEKIVRCKWGKKGVQNWRLN